MNGGVAKISWWSPATGASLSKSRLPGRLELRHVQPVGLAGHELKISVQNVLSKLKSQLSAVSAKKWSLIVITSSYDYETSVVHLQMMWLISCSTYQLHVSKVFVILWGNTCVCVRKHLVAWPWTDALRGVCGEIQILLSLVSSILGNLTAFVPTSVWPLPFTQFILNYAYLIKTSF